MIFLPDYNMLKKIEKKFISMANANSTEDMIIKLQTLKSKTKSKFYKKIRNFKMK